MADMSERFTDRAQKVMKFANQEARSFNHEYIGTEHLLLGLVREGSGVAANVLKNLNMDLNKVRRETEKIIQPGPGGVMPGELPQTPRTKRVLEFAIEEARNLNHNYVGTEHLLLGLLRAEEGVAAQILKNLGLTLSHVRQEIFCLLGGNASPQLPPLDFSEDPKQELPAEIMQTIAELNSRIEQLSQMKEDAVAEQDFEKAANLRDQVNKTREEKAHAIRDWTNKYEIDSAWLSWNDGIVARLANTILRKNSWQTLPLLGEALKAAGCTNQEILEHCRQPGEHDNNCWVVTLLLSQT